MKKQGKTLLLAALGLAVIIAAYGGLRYVQRQQTTAEYDSNDSVVLNDFKKEDILALSYTQNDTTLSFEKKGELWQVTGEESFPLNQEELGRMVYYTAGLTAQRQLAAEAPDPAGYGLDPAEKTIQITLADGSKASYYLGKQLPDGTGYYLMAAGNPALFLASTLFHDTFSASLPQLAQLDNIHGNLELADVSYFSVSRPQDQLTFGQTPGGTTELYTDQYRWQISSNGQQYQAAATEPVATLLKSILALSYQSCVSYQVTPEELTAFGLTDPIRIDVDYLPSPQEGEAAADQVIASFHLQLGGTAPDGSVYAHLAGSPMVGTVDGKILTALQYSGTADFLPLDICLIDLVTVNSLDITAADKTMAQITVDRSTKPVTYRMGDKVLKEEAFTSFYEALTTMQADTTTTTGNSVKSVKNTPALTITFHRNTPNFPQMTLQFLPYDDQFYLVDFNSRCDLLANKRDVEALLKRIQAL